MPIELLHSRNTIQTIVPESNLYLKYLAAEFVKFVR